MPHQRSVPPVATSKRVHILAVNLGTARIFQGFFDVQQPTEKMMTRWQNYNRGNTIVLLLDRRDWRSKQFSYPNHGSIVNPSSIVTLKRKTFNAFHRTHVLRTL
jgi:hypothetical protein